MKYVDEQTLIRKILDGDKEAVRIFYERNKKRLFEFIFRKVLEKKDAEEILQDTFLSAIDSLALFSGKSSLLTFLGGIAKHEIADYYKKKRIKAIVFSRFENWQFLIDKSLRPDEQLVKKELSLRIKSVLKKILPRYKGLIRLKYIEGFSVKEIANNLKISEKSVESALFRARKAFVLAFVEESRKENIKQNRKGDFIEA
jgi:RNA polymerase sigma-70 factor (ECF subfamily)